MDSFYDAPRRPPQPLTNEKFLSATPVVPEISILCPSNVPNNNFTPYNQWKKDAITSNFLVMNKENINNHFRNTQNNSILKKQVRFESPVLLHSPVERDIPISSKTNLNPLKNDSPYNDGRSAPSFEQMYMANIPNRQLDLSLIDIPKKIPENNNKKNPLEKKEQPKTYKEFLDCQKIDDIVINDSVTDIFNYKRKKKENNVLNSTVMNNSNEMPRNGNKQYSPLLSSNASQVISKNSQFEQKQNKEREQLKQTYTCLTEAIANRNVPRDFDTLQTQSGEQIKNDTPQMQWLTSQNIDKRLGNNAFSSDTVAQRNHSFQMQGEIFPQDFNQRQGQNESKTNRNLDSNLLSVDHNKLKCDTMDVLKKRECCTQTSNDLDTLENIALRPKPDDNISAKDLLKIIALQSQQMAQQNEQMLLLQKQVSELISRQSSSGCSKQKSIQCGKENDCCHQCQNHNELRHCCSGEQYGMQRFEQKQSFVPSLISKNMENIQDRCITSTQHENCDQKRIEGTPKKNKNQLQNFSIGLTTSFEVSIRRPTNKNQNDYCQKDKPMQYFEQQESPKIQELTENDTVEDQKNYRQKDYKEQKNVEFDNKETLIDTSMVFKEPIRVRESCPSPEPSIKINMNDFEDSEDDDDDMSSSAIGPSFYRNLMVQVNKILQKAQIETREDMAYNIKGQQLKNETLHKVKEATLKHLKRIGVEVQNSENSSQSSSFSDGIDCNSYNQDEISFAVKQLLMKYLPADHLAKLAYNESPSRKKASLTPKEKHGTIKNRPDFSFATVQYMKKYNLISSNPRDPYKASKPNQSESPKILDISKLKLQPKLL